MSLALTRRRPPSIPNLTIAHTNTTITRIMIRMEGEKDQKKGREIEAGTGKNTKIMEGAKTWNETGAAAAESAKVGRKRAAEEMDTVMLILDTSKKTEARNDGRGAGAGAGAGIGHIDRSKNVHTKTCAGYMALNAG